ncbi:MAG: DUF177 domain-containing protein [Cytophagales bacterium]|nr:DUF177 domain-containing protein [Cytophagales bacterium]
MKGLNAYKIDILALPEGRHEYKFDLGDAFFQSFEHSLVDRGQIVLGVVLDKRPALIELHLDIKGSVVLVCDRSLDQFDFPMDHQERLHFKYGEQEEELSDDLYVITESTASLDVGLYAYEIISVQVPLKKLHPRYQTGGEDEDELFYTDKTEDEADELSIDPRWEALRKLRKDSNDSN